VSLNCAEVTGGLHSPSCVTGSSTDSPVCAEVADLRIAEQPGPSSAWTPCAQAAARARGDRLQPQALRGVHGGRRGRRGRHVGRGRARNSTAARCRWSISVPVYNGSMSRIPFAHPPRAGPVPQGRCPACAAAWPREFLRPCRGTPMPVGPSRFVGRIRLEIVAVSGATVERACAATPAPCAAGPVRSAHHRDCRALIPSAGGHYVMQPQLPECTHRCPRARSWNTRARTGVLSTKRGVRAGRAESLAASCHTADICRGVM